MEIVRSIQFNENPFKNAHQESIRLEELKIEKQLQREKFDCDLKERLRAYKKINVQLNENTKLGILDKNKATYLIAEEFTLSRSKSRDRKAPTR